jgi:DNA polymerase-3 subunit epsilon
MKPGTYSRNIAITDLETTGFDPEFHEIIEIGLVVVHPDTLAVIDEFECKVKPEKIETADFEALKVNGYDPQEWKDAMSLYEALGEYQKKVVGAVFMAHPAVFDRSFLNAAFKKTGLSNPLHFHSLDLFSMAWPLLKSDPKVSSISLRSLCQRFGLEPEVTPHRAINGARIAHQIFLKLMQYHREREQGPNQLSLG